MIKFKSRIFFVGFVKKLILPYVRHATCSELCYFSRKSQIFWEISTQNVYNKRDCKPVFICVHDCLIPISYSICCLLNLYHFYLWYNKCNPFWDLIVPRIKEHRIILLFNIIEVFHEPLVKQKVCVYFIWESGESSEYGDVHMWRNKS